VKYITVLMILIIICPSGLYITFSSNFVTKRNTIYQNNPKYYTGILLDTMKYARKSKDMEYHKMVAIRADVTPPKIRIFRNLTKYIIISDEPLQSAPQIDVFFTNYTSRSGLIPTQINSTAWEIVIPHVKELTITATDLAGNTVTRKFIIWREPYRELAEYWAPKIVQDTDDSNYKADYLTRFDYDGDYIGNNNWENLDYYPVPGWVYYAVIETETHWFIFYAFFHPRDWNDVPDAGAGEHENDMEGVMLVIRKVGKFGYLELMETRAHMDYYQYINSSCNIQEKNETIDGSVQFDNGTDVQGGGRIPIVFIEAKGHGVYAYGDGGLPGGDDWVEYWYYGFAEEPSGGNDRNVSYDLIPILTTLWPYRFNIGDGKTYDKPFVYQGHRYSFSLKIGSAFDGSGPGALSPEDAANPPWGWNDTNGIGSFDRAGDFFFDPAWLVNEHFYMPEPFSLTYVYNPYLESDSVVYPDDVPPTIIIREPANNSYVNSDTVTIKWDVWEDSSLYQFEIYVDNILVATLDSSAKQYSLTLSEGAHKITVRAYDSYRNWDETSIVITVDKTPPNIVITSPENDSWHNTRTIIVSWDMSDNNGIDYVAVYVNDSLVGTTTETSYTLTLEEGASKITVICYDIAGNSDNDSIIVHVDVSKPSIKITNPNNYSWFNTQFTVEWIASDNFGIKTFMIYINNVFYMNTTKNIVDLDLGEGTHEIKVVAVDFAENTNSSEIIVYVDKTSPSIEISEPQNDSWLSSTTVNVSWTADDNMGINKYQIYVNNQLYDETTNTWIIVQLNDGDYNITVRAIDNAGNINEDTIIIHIDTHPPSIQITQPQNDTYVASTSVVVKWTANDDRGLKVFEVYLDEELYASVVGYQITIEGLTEGQHTIKVIAFDLASNTNDSIVEITVDVTPPNIYIIAPKNNSWHSTKSITITWNAFDTYGINKYEIYVDLAYVDTCYDNSYSLILKEGTHEIKVVAYDKAGNTNASIVVINIDITPPRIVLKSPTNDSWFNTLEILVTWNASDNIDIQVIRVYLNGSLVTETTSNSVYIQAYEGLNNVTVVAIDYANNTNRSLSLFYADITAPSITVYSPRNNSITNETEIQLHVESSDNLRYDHMDILLNSSLIETTQNETCLMTVNLSDGHYEFTIIAYDYVGNRKEVKIYITIDTSALVIDIVCPQNDTWFNTNLVEYEIEVYNARGSFEIKIYANNTLIKTTNETKGTLQLNEGFYCIKFVVNDSIGKVASKIVYIHIDLHSPRVIITAPENNSILNVSTITLSWDGNDNMGIAYYLIYLNETLAYNTSENSCELKLDDGVHAIKVIAYDFARNSNSCEIIVRIDTSIPQIMITQPDNQSYISSSEIIISWSCTENVSEYRIFINNTYYCSVTNTSIKLYLNEGAYEIKITCTDSAGNAGKSILLVTIDITCPQIEIIAPSNNSIHNVSEVLIEWNAYDNFEIDSIEIYLDDEYFTTTKQNYVELQLEDGIHEVNIIVYDKAGNAASTRIVIEVDTKPPLIWIISPGNNSWCDSNAVNISWNGSDDITKYVIYVNGTLIRELNETIYELNINESGCYEIKIKAIDHAGNSNTSVLVLFFDLEPPHVIIFSPANETLFNSSIVPLNASVYDDVKVAYIIILKNGTLYANTTSLPAELHLTDGKWNITIIAYDYRNKMNKGMFLIIVDTTPPSLEILSPENNSMITSNVIEMETHIEDLTNVTINVFVNNSLVSTNGNTTITFDKGGIYIIKVTVIDSCNHITEKSVKVTVDLFKPSLVILSPDNETWINNSRILIRFYADDDTKVKNTFVIINDTYVFQNDTEVIVKLSDGTYIINITAIDISGKAASKILIIHIDATPPEIDILSLQNRTYVTGNVRIQAIINAKPHLKYVCVLINGTVLVNQTENEVDLSVELSDGVWRISIIAVEELTKSEKSIIIISDLQPPTLHVVCEPKNNSITNDDVAEIEISVNDNIRVKEIYVFLNDVLIDIIYDNVTMQLSLQDGLNVIKIIAKDNAGNEATTQIFIMVDKIPPTVEIITPKPYEYITTNEFLLQWKASDETGIQFFEIFINDTLYAQTENTSIIVRVSYEGTYKIQVVAYDMAGNKGSCVITVYVKFELNEEKPETQHAGIEFNTLLIILVIIGFIGVALAIRKAR